MGLNPEHAPAVLLRNVCIVDPQSEHHNQWMDLLIKAGRIAEIAPAGAIDAGRAGQTVEIDGACVSPGWLDMQVHLCDPGYEYKETLHALAGAARIGGFTGIVCYPNTAPVVDNSQMLYSLRNRASVLPVDLHFTGTISEKGQGKELAEVYDMREAGAIAFTDGTQPIQSSGLLLRALQYMQPFGALMLRYPQDNSLAAHGQMNEGPQSTLMGMKGIPEMAESIALARDLQLIDYAPGKVHFQPLTATESLRLIAEAKAKHSSISTGTTAAHLAFDDSMLEGFDPNFKLIPPIRNREQVMTLKQAVKSGVIDVITSGHQAQSIEEKNLEFELAEPGMLGLQTTFSLAYAQLVETHIIPLERLIELISIAPRRILALPPVSVTAGQDANLTLFHLGRKWTLEGRHLPARSKNTPLLGQQLSGQVLGIYHKGALHLG